MVRPCLGGRGGRGAGRVAVEFDVGLCGFDVIYHGAELMNEADQGHIHVLTDGLTGEGEMAVNAGLRSTAQLVERQRAGGGRGGHALFQDDGIQAERLYHQSGFEIERGKIQYALPETHIFAKMR